MSVRPDVAGIWSALAQLPDRTPEQRRADRIAANATRAAHSMQNGNRWRTRPAPSPRRVEPCCVDRLRFGHRGEAGRFVPCPDRLAA